MDKACFHDFLFLMKIPKHKSLIVLFMNENVRDSGHLQFQFLFAATLPKYSYCYLFRHNPF